MELKALIEIFVKYKRMFWSIVILFLIGGCVFYIVQPRRYNVSTTITVIRSNLSEKNNEKEKNFENDYSSFYRAQADDRIADSIVAWLKSPSIVLGILKSSEQKNLSDIKIKNLSSVYKVNKVSSQVIDLRFKVLNPEDGKKQVIEINKRINELLKKMNPESSTNSWFKVSLQKPVIRFYEKTPLFVFLMSVVLGFFVSFCVTIIVNYLKEEK